MGPTTLTSPPVSRILCRVSSVMAIYLGPPLLVGLMRPTWDVTGGPPCPCLVLLRTGFT